MKYEYKAGDKVYAPPIGTDIYTLENGDSDSYAVKIPHVESFTLDGKLMRVHKLPTLFPVTEENHQLLSKLYGVEFKKPSLRGSELTKKLLENGWDCVPCWGSNCSDEHARQYKCKDIVYSLKSGSFCFENSMSCNFAVPFDPRTGKELTDEMLDD